MTEKEEIFEDDEGEELEIGASQAPSIFKDIINKPEIRTYLFFMFVTQSACTINQNVAQVYMSDELKFPKEAISQFMIISAPVNILTSILSGYFTAKSPFKFFYQSTVACVLVSSYSILVLI